MPDYFRNNPERWFKTTVESCCEHYYNWDYNECITDSGGSTSTSATFKWYVNHHEEVCQQDCPEVASKASCGGLAKTWDQLYESVTACCEDRVSWIPSSSCESKSLGMSIVGTSLWYPDFVLEKCVKDCEDSADPSCKGFAKSWDDLYSTSSECCDRLWWVDRSECSV